MKDIYTRMDLVDVNTRSSEMNTIMICIHRIDELLDEEMRLLDQGAIDQLERVNIRKTHLLDEFARISSAPAITTSSEINNYLHSCRRKAERNFEALRTYLSALEDLSTIILDHLRNEESDGTYSRPVIKLLRDEKQWSK